MSRLIFTPLPKNATLAQKIQRIFKLIVVNAGGEASMTFSSNDQRFELWATMKKGEYVVFTVLEKYGNHYAVTEFTSHEKDSDMGAPYWMPAEWTLAYSLKPGEKWEISCAQNLLALFEAHTKWSKIEGYDTVFEPKKDKNI